MKTLESAPSDIDPRYQSILDAPPSSVSQHRQMQLMVACFVRKYPDVDLDSKSIEKAAEEWGESGNSKKFSDLLKDPRFAGDPANITVEDMME